MPDLLKKPVLILVKCHVYDDTLSPEGRPCVWKLPASPPALLSAATLTAVGALPDPEAHTG